MPKSTALRINFSCRPKLYRNRIKFATSSSRPVKILILDNFDSFTYNLLHYVECFDVECKVVRNNDVKLDMLNEFDKVILSPGPGLPKNAGAMMPFIAHCIGRKPLLGICLGMQGIVEYFGGRIIQMDPVSHGIAMDCTVLDEKDPLFHSIPKQFTAGMYHSWCVDPEHLPDELNITAKGKNGVVMGVRHEKLDVRGLQFHPESIMTPHGKKMIGNWLGRSENQIISA